MTSPATPEPPPSPPVLTPGEIAGLRRVYAAGSLDVTDAAPDPIEQFRRWLAQAVAAALPEPNAMILSTADASGRPSGRTVLLKGVDERGFVFFTNYESRKGRELAENPRAALTFPWYPLQRQVVVSGTVHRVAREETEAYFASRPRDSQLGAWASRQSAPVASRADLDRAYEEMCARFPAGVPIPAPAHWGGLRVAPEAVEFWQGRRGRLHDRLEYRRRGVVEWEIVRLSP